MDDAKHAHGDLIKRLREAPEGCRELDASIRFECFDDMTRCNFDEGCYHGDCKSPGCGDWLGMHDERQSYPVRWQDDERLPYYTTSLDAALTLVLPGYRIQITFDVPDGGGFVWIGDDWDSMKLRWTWNSDELEGDQDDPVILTCIAALKANAEEG